jgi:hypothetical protein
MFKSRKIISINRKKPAICSTLMRFATETSLVAVVPPHDYLIAAYSLENLPSVIQKEFCNTIGT